MSESQPVAKPSLSFAKLVATPTDTAWSQVYNAGNVFVCLALSRETIEQEEAPEIHDGESLQMIGRETFNVLQSEFFGLEEKNSATIKQAIQTSLENVPPEIAVSLALAFFTDGMLAVFVSGSGKIILKRKEKIGTLLDTQETEDDAGIAASGYVQNGDTVILQTGQFAAGVDDSMVAEALELELPTDIVEALSPRVHEQDNGAQSAIVISYRGGAPAPVSESLQEESEEPEETDEIGATEETQEPLLSDVAGEEKEGEATLGSLAQHEEPIRHTEETDHEPAQKSWKRFLPSMPSALPRIALPHIQMNHRRKLFLNIAVIIFLLLGASIFFTMKQHNDAQQHEQFTAIYSEAQQLYEEGQGLETLNPSMSQESYQKAEALLLEGQEIIDEGSSEYQQLEELLTKVQNSLQNTTAGQSVDVTEITPEANNLLAVAQDTKALGYGQDENTVYYVTADTVTAVSKNNGNESTVIENDDDWSAARTVIPYQTNLYVLDQKEGIIKFVPSGEGYSATNYFSGSAPDLSQATGMAIDGSIWLVFSNGSVEKYTSGSNDNLTLLGLETPLKNPKAIATSLEMGNVYVLDAGNSRIVQFSKSGSFESAYTAPILSTATVFTVAEDEQTAQVLSEGKVWELTF